jgi:hypothetical protein
MVGGAAEFGINAASSLVTGAFGKINGDYFFTKLSKI